MPRIRPLVLALLVAQPASAEPIQDKLLAGARAASAETLAFTRTTRVEERSGGTPDVKTRVDRYDPARPRAQRWTLVSLDGRAPTSDEIVAEARRLSPKARIILYADLLARARLAKAA